ncbi:hypothetical protein EYF80_014790 [Liparis tanakae]|uniref:Uncharacterized protein n=1 Tax=Liparis tanakae TaxID=230148 RepID=A0A4Z2ICG0_9TELE|nr:hypothetical protein EYF80_014790 [Liparis tanakae]
MPLCNHPSHLTPPPILCLASFRFTSRLTTSCAHRFQEHPSSSEKWRAGGEAVEREAGRWGRDHQSVRHFDAEDSETPVEREKKEEGGSGVEEGEPTYVARGHSVQTQRCRDSQALCVSAVSQTGSRMLRAADPALGPTSRLTVAVRWDGQNISTAATDTTKDSSDPLRDPNSYRVTEGSQSDAAPRHRLHSFRLKNKPRCDIRQAVVGHAAIQTVPKHEGKLSELSERLLRRRRTAVCVTVATHGVQKHNDTSVYTIAEAGASLGSAVQG